MTSKQKWEIWLAHVRFEDTPDEKKRPVLIVESGGTVTVHCLKLTSHIPRAGEYAIQRWRESGLIKQTTVRIGKHLSLTHDKFIHKIGRLSPIDIMGVLSALTR